jgi:hypothetical protein
MEVTMSRFYDSYEAERLRKLIAHKETYLQTLQGDKAKVAYQLTQREIMLLRNDILPLVLMNSNIVHSEFAKYAVKCFDTASIHKLNGVLIYQPLELHFTDKPRIGICNPMANMGTEKPGVVEVFIDNYEGVEAQCINLNSLIS